MKLTEIYAECRARLGFWIVGNRGDITELGMQLEDLWSMVRHDLKWYQGYIPVAKTFNVNTSNNFYDFNQDPNNPGYLCYTTTPVTIGGSKTTGDTLSFTVSDITLGNSPVTVSYVVVEDDTLATIAAAMAALVNALSPLIVVTYVSGDSFSIVSKTNNATSYTSNVHTGGTETIVIGIMVPTVISGWVPKRLQRVVPIGDLSITDTWLFAAELTYLTTTFDFMNPNSLANDRRFSFRYQPRRLSNGTWTDTMMYVTENGPYDVTAFYNYYAIETKDDNGNLIDVDIIDLYDESSHTNRFLDLCAGRFLESFGRSQRRTTESNSPIVSDEATLVTEGMAMVKDAKLEIVNNAPITNAIKAQ